MLQCWEEERPPSREQQPFGLLDQQTRLQVNIACCLCGLTAVWTTPSCCRVVVALCGHTYTCWYYYCCTYNNDPTAVYNNHTLFFVLLAVSSVFFSLLSSQIPSSPWSCRQALCVCPSVTSYFLFYHGVVGDRMKQEHTRKKQKSW